MHWQLGKNAEKDGSFGAKNEKIREPQTLNTSNNCYRGQR